MKSLNHREHREHRDGVAADVTERIIGCAIRVHEGVGPGLLESVYLACMCHELTLAGLEFQREKAIPIRYRGVQLECGFRADLIVAGTVLVELKAVDAILPVHESQVLSYMRLANLPVGLLINFHSKLLRTGLRRFVT